MTLTDVDHNSNWITGLDWISLHISDFPMKSCEEIELDSIQTKNSNDELIQPKIHQSMVHVYARKLPLEVAERYKFSDYIIDPNSYDFLAAIRIMALVIKFIKKIREKIARQ